MEQEFRKVYVPGFGFFKWYEVSSEGVVKSIDHITIDRLGKHKPIKGKVLSPKLEKNGYYRVWLGEGYNNCYSIARIVAFAFPEICGEYFEGATINHNNEIKTDNNASNLSWMSQAENNCYGTRLERVSKNRSGKGKPMLMLKNGKPYFIWRTKQEAMNNEFPDGKRLHYCLKDPNKTYKGFTFQYF